MEFTNYEELSETGVEYIPEFNDNKDLPEEEQMIFLVRPMTNKLRKIYDKLQKHKLVGKKTEKELQTNTHYVQEKVFAACVLKTTNVSIRSPKTNEIDRNPDVELLYNALPPQLTMEILSAIDDYSVLEAGTKKR